MKKLILILLLFSNSLSADDSFIGTWSANISPMKKQSKDIQMVKEIVYVKMHQDSSEVFCKFWFYNSGKTQTVKVGFPDARSGENTKTYQIENFKTLVNGKITKTEPFFYLESIDSNSWDNNGIVFDTLGTTWYVKDVDFKEHDTTIIEDYYTGKYGGYIGGDSIAYLYISFYYFLGPGKTWKGSINSGTIIFDQSDFLSNYFSDYHSSNKPKIILTKLTDYSIFTFRNYKPENNATVSVGILEPRDQDESSYVSNFSLIPFMKSAKYNINDINYLKNELLARLGKPLEDSALLKYFSDKPWFDDAKEGKLKYSKKLLERYLFDINSYLKSIKHKKKENANTKLKFHPDNENELLKMIEDAEREFSIEKIK